MRWALIPELLWRLAWTCKKDTVSLSPDASVKQPVATFNADRVFSIEEMLCFFSEGQKDFTFRSPGSENAIPSSNSRSLLISS